MVQSVHLATQHIFYKFHRQTGHLHSFFFSTDHDPSKRCRISASLFHPSQLFSDNFLFSKDKTPKVKLALLHFRSQNLALYSTYSCKYSLHFKPTIIYCRLITRAVLDFISWRSRFQTSCLLSELTNVFAWIFSVLFVYLTCSVFSFFMTALFPYFLL